MPRRGKNKKTSPIVMSSLSPPPIPMELHAGNRQKLVDSIRRHLSNSDRPLDGFVLLQVLLVARICKISKGLSMI